MSLEYIKSICKNHSEMKFMIYQFKGNMKCDMKNHTVCFTDKNGVLRYQNFAGPTPVGKYETADDESLYDDFDQELMSWLECRYDV